jgi:transcriptional regulator with XRE-family HTH domain
MVTFESIGAKIKKLRIESDFTQSDMAELLNQKGLNISRETFNKIEKGNRSISVIEFNALAEILRVSTEELMNEIEEDEDLVTLFRKRRDISEEEEYFLDEFQSITKALISQEKIHSGTYKRSRRTPKWKVQEGVNGY